MSNFTKFFVCALLLVIGFAYSWTVSIIGYVIWAIFNFILNVQEKNSRIAIFDELADELADELNKENAIFDELAKKFADRLNKEAN